MGLLDVTHTIIYLVVAFFFVWEGGGGFSLREEWNTNMIPFYV